jgi:hypothetical protein
VGSSRRPASDFRSVSASFDKLLRQPAKLWLTPPTVAWDVNIGHIHLPQIIGFLRQKLEELGRLVQFRRACSLRETPVTRMVKKVRRSKNASGISVPASQRPGFRFGLLCPVNSFRRPRGVFFRQMLLLATCLRNRPCCGSRSLPIIIPQQSAQAFPANQRPFLLAYLRSRLQNPMVQPLMWALSMIMK